MGTTAGGPSRRVSPHAGFPRLAAPRPPPIPPGDGRNYRNEAVRGGANVTVRVKPTALPLNVSLVMPRCGSSVNVAIMIDAGFSRYGPRARKSGIPYTVVFMKSWALGLTIMARIHGSLN